MNRRPRSALLLATLLAAALALGLGCRTESRAAEPAAPAARPATATALPAAPVTASPRRVPAASPVPTDASPPMFALRALATPAADTFGVVVVAHTDGDGVNLHPSPSLDETLGVYPEGTRLTVLGEEHEADGRRWLPVRAPDGVEGWVVADYTAPAPSDSGAPPAPTSAPPPASGTGTSSHPWVVALDPGHGGSEIGASHPGFGGGPLREKDLNLAIALKLAALLRADGDQVVLTRTTDSQVNVDAADLNGNGVVDNDDDLQARVDVANAANADVLLSIHNNGGSPDARGTSVWYCADHPQGARARQLAQLLQEAFLQRLRGAGYEPLDLGANDDPSLAKPYGHLFVVGVQTPRVARPSRMPGVVGESLFVTNDTEAALLARDDVLDALASAYRDAVRAFLDGSA